MPAIAVGDGRAVWPGQAGFVPCRAVAVAVSKGVAVGVGDGLAGLAIGGVIA